MKTKEQSCASWRSLLWPGMFAMLLFAVLALCATHANAASVIASGNCGAQGDNVKWSLDSGGTLTISGSGEMEDYECVMEPYAPWTWSGPFNVSNNNSRIHSVVIKSGVTSIGKAAFSFCTKLESISIPNSVMSIGEFAFGNLRQELESRNTVLENITIPNGVTTIGTCAFRGCMRLSGVTIPASVTEIGEFAFGFCPSLTAFQVNSANKFFSSDANGCLYNKNKTELIQYPIGNSRTSFTVPNGITTISSDAFNFSMHLTSVTIPSSVSDIKSSAFLGCSYLVSITVNTANPKYSSDTNGCLYNKDKTKLIQYPIGNGASSFTVPNSVTSVGDEAFAYSSHLTSITFPDSVATIGFYALYDCEVLKTVRILNPKCEIYSLQSNTKSSSVTLYGYKNSTAQTYAQQNNLTFVEIAHTHTYGAIVVERKPTCSQTGLQYQACTICGERVNETSIPKTAHTYKKVSVTATMTKDGSIFKQCTVCGKKGKAVAIPKVSTLKLSKTSYVYTGKVRTPSLIIQDANGKTLKKNTDYKVAYAKGRTECGTYKVVVKLMGNYSGKVTLKFKIKLAKVTGITQTDRDGVYLKWNKVIGATRYDIYVYSGGKYNRIKSDTDTWVENKKLRSGTKVTMQIRAVRVLANGTETYSAVTYTATAK